MKNDTEEIYRGVSKFYAERIKEQESTPAPSCCGTDEKPSAGGFAKYVGYTEDELQSIPEEAAGSSFGCGNPLAFSGIGEGEVVLDLGSGAGIDCFLAANRVGKSGRVIGLDMTPEMIQKAKDAAREGGYSNVEFLLGRNEEMPVESASVDWVVSNCVINLSPEKDRVFSEAFRVLRPGGRVLVSDIVAENIPDSMKDDIAAWAGCVAGAVSEEEYVRIMRDAGFGEVAVVDRVEHKMPEGSGPASISSIRVSAVKPNGADERSKKMEPISNVIDVETQLLISVGSAVAAGCIPCLEGIVEKARAAGIDEKKMRAAARTGQFVKDQPAAHMKKFADELLGTHLRSEAEASGGGCPMEGEAGVDETTAAGTGDEAPAPSGGCGCGA